MDNARTDAQLRARTEVLLTEAVVVAEQLRLQTQRLASAIDLFRHQARIIRDDEAETHDADE